MAKIDYHGDSASGYFQLLEEQRYEEDMELRRKELQIREMEAKSKIEGINSIRRQLDELSRAVDRLDRKLDSYETRYFNPFIEHISPKK